MPKPRVVILAGPNGAGKTTVAKYLLPEKFGITEFVNADTIAAGLSAYAPETVAFEAGRIMLTRIDALSSSGASFAFETTLSSRTLFRRLQRARAAGYEVVLFYVALPSVQLAQRRVAKRVKEGGHAIPLEVIARRFYRSLANLLRLYRSIADAWFVYDNSRSSAPELIALGFEDVETILEPDKWQRLKKLAVRANN